MLMRKCYTPWIGSPYIAIFLRCLTAYYYRTDYLTKSIIKIIYFGLNVYFGGCAGARAAERNSGPRGRVILGPLQIE